MSNNSNCILTLGWREWVNLPILGLPTIKAKVDTGARTSSLHAFKLRPRLKNGIERIEFSIHPFQNDTKTVLTCESDVIDKRYVTDSGGHQEERWVINTPVTIGNYTWLIDITLTDRDNMKFRMLLGRHAIKGVAVVDSSASYLVGKKPLPVKSPASN